MPHKNTINNKKKHTKKPKIIKNVHDKSDIVEIQQKYLIGICCFCQEDCNPLSQSCGQCLRNSLYY